MADSDPAPSHPTISDSASHDLPAPPHEPVAAGSPDAGSEIDTTALARLSLRGVGVVLASTPILRDVTMEAPRGDFLGILGPNGSGKTTLLRTIARSIPPHEGVLLLDDRELRRFSSKALARRMAVVPQVSAPTLDFTAGELVRMGRAPHQGRWGAESRRDRDIAREAMELTDTLPFVDRLAGTLSGGEYQRVLVARALAQEPELLLLDEPTAHLDLSAQIRLLELLHRLNREKRITIIAVLHDLNLAASYCRRLMLMTGGRVAAYGSPDEVLTAGRLREVYGTEVLVRRHPLTGRPMVLPVPGAEAAYPEGPRPRIHIACGGGTGASLLRTLAARGYPVTAGALNIGDSDHAAALEVKAPVAAAPPFSPLTDESLAEARRMMEEAETVVLTDTPFGPGNLPMLGAVRDATAGGKPLYLLRNRDGIDWDFTGGTAAREKARLTDGGATVVDTAAELLAALTITSPVESTS